MQKIDLALMELLRRGLRGGEAEDPALSPEEWLRLLWKADFHKLLPLVLDQALRLPSLRQAAAAERAAAFADSGKQDPASEDRPLAALQNSAVEQACRQAMQENEFLNLLLELRAAGLEPLVVKGPVCRALYPKPLLRPSVADDLLIPPDQGPASHQAMLELGLTPDDPKADPEGDYELSYHDLRSGLYLELHKELFNPQDPAFQGFNRLFEGAQARAVPIMLQDVDCKTLCPRDHMLFLILHAYKHFIHSGFGIRIVADICLFARAHREELDLGEIRSVCQSLRCDRFLTALFQIGEKHLSIPAPDLYRTEQEDLEPLLADILESGIHGQDLDRLHSAPITLRTVGQRGQGRAKGSLRAALFPPAENLKKHYPFLEKHPALLPLAGGKRIVTYLTDRRAKNGVNPSATLRIAKERIRLLERYGILEESSRPRE